jgi:membrane protease YdiL (CAAX protease family)
MRPARSLLIYGGIVFIGGALLAPWLYWAVQGLSPRFAILEGLASQPFHRYVHRSMLVLALVGVPPFLRGLGLRRLQDVGLVKPAGQGRALSGGLALGFTSLACVAAAVVAAGARALNTGVTAGRFLATLSSAALTAAVVSVIEEILFRGAIYGALRRSGRRGTALLTSSAVYALVHFFNRPPSPPEIDWASGLGVLAGMLQGFADVEQLVPGFLNLALAGGVLAVAYERTGNLTFSIGLHAGWIFWLKSYGALTRETAGAGAGFWGTGKLIDGWPALPVLALVLWILWKRMPRSPTAVRTPLP